MCGICGLVAAPELVSQLSEITRDMTRRLHHRGPDDSDIWCEPESALGLGHARLSIIDLSPLGRQPMHSSSGEWALTYNGEIYNFPQLRTELESLGNSFQGHSDSEVLCQALQEWGFEKTLGKLRGMYAFAAWHRPTAQLFLARDALGQKPLFYGFFQGSFVFGSELRVLRALPQRPGVDREAASLMIRYACVPEPYTIYEGFSKLPPASFVVYHAQEKTVSRPVRLWTPPVGVARPRKPTLEGALQLLEEAVRLRMVSDVPIGAFLSGGIDSTLITALMQKVSPTPIKSFTVAFDDPRYNEGDHARAIADHLGTDHTELRFQEAQALQIVPRLGEIYDEPFADPSQVPTVLLCQLTRQHVTVALSGDGGDELFRGYNRAVWLPQIDRQLKPLPHRLRRMLASVLRSNLIGGLLESLASLGLVKTRLVRDKLKKLAALMEAEDFRARYRALLSQWSESPLVIGSSITQIDEFRNVPESLSIEDQLALVDFFFYLPDDILVKVDRASMSTGLEVRSPFLDHQLVNYCSGFEQQHNVQRKEGKMLLRKMLARLVPAELTERPKMGFAAPIRDWLRGPLRSWAGDLLYSQRVREEGLLRFQPIERAWEDLQGGRSDTSHQLWNVLMLASWLEADTVL